MKKTIAIMLVATGAIAIAWPFLPQEWGFWEFMGWLFDASDDPSMGIQYMFFWMVTFIYGLFAVPLGAAMLAKQKPQPTLTDEEREAVEFAVETGRVATHDAAILRKMLERLAVK
jgi:hypothetical protein